MYTVQLHLSKYHAYIAFLSKTHKLNQTASFSCFRFVKNSDTRHGACSQSLYYYSANKSTSQRSIFTIEILLPVRRCLRRPYPTESQIGTIRYKGAHRYIEKSVEY